MDDTFYIVIGAIVLLLGILFFVNVASKMTKVRVMVVEDLAQEVLSHLIFLRIEEHPEGMFAYDAMIGDFICQGKNMEDLNVNFGKRYPNKKGVIVQPEKGETNEFV